MEKYPYWPCKQQEGRKKEPQHIARKAENSNDLDIAKWSGKNTREGV